MTSKKPVSPWMKGSLPDRKWKVLATGIFRRQFRYNRIFRDWCHSHAPFMTPRENIPGLPLLAFKESKVASFRVTRNTSYFQSSGTTSGRGKTSRHYHPSLDLYRTSVVEGWGWFLRESEFEAKFAKARFLALMPSCREAPHSSLSCMLETLMRACGDGQGFWSMQGGRWNWSGLAKEMGRSRDAPMVLFGTAFGWVHFLDWCARHRRKFRLGNALVIETGGYKGRSRELERDDLHAQLAGLLGVPRSRVRSEYSMCEISSQAYSFPHRGTQLFRFPPWCRAQVMRPGTAKICRPGEKGVLEIHDLANVDSCAFIRTEDMAIAHPEGFELAGRLPKAGLKGCSLAFE